MTKDDDEYFSNKKLLVYFMFISIFFLSFENNARVTYYMHLFVVVV